ncbi:hypothetical protein [Aliarcobacter lanthieri]|uniref:hypothetical protein n=1 Tax=Aliarcobacter lanthieri TaxID=1355374 RepID=UPI0004797961|nr:hypothetical protein [Aliarcobacter lanthieri]QKF59812.1 hypothetical protein ALANTH_1711 [Aliarcobacter lanthieri]
MTPFVLSKDILIIELETSEKINDKYLKSFIQFNLKLKNISLNQNDIIYINFIENIKEYQLFIVTNGFKFFEFEVFHTYIDKNSNGFTLFICQDFFIIFKNTNLYYYQKISQNINEYDFLQFLEKRFKIKIEKIYQISPDILKNLKIEFLKNFSKKHYKEPLKKFELKKDFSFYIYIFYLFIVIYFAFYYFQNIKKYEEKEQNIVKIEDIKEKYSFISFEERFYKILENIDKNRLTLISFEFRQNRAKIVINHKNKDNINLFLESCGNVLTSSINFLDDSKKFEAIIDVEFTQK